MKTYTITQEQINKIFELMKTMHMFKVKKLLLDLPESKTKLNLQEKKK